MKLLRWYSQGKWKNQRRAVYLDNTEFFYKYIRFIKTYINFSNKWNLKVIKSITTKIEITIWNYDWLKKSLLWIGFLIYYNFVRVDHFRPEYNFFKPSEVKQIRMIYFTVWGIQTKCQRQVNYFPNTRDFVILYVSLE